MSQPIIQTLRIITYGNPAYAYTQQHAGLGNLKQHPIHPADAALLLEAIAIADESAIADIECESHRKAIDGVYWYDIEQQINATDKPPEEISFIARARDYLAKRGLLTRDQTTGLYRFVVAT